MSHWMVDLLLNPDTFFRERADQEAGLKFPLLCVLLAGLAMAPGAYKSVEITGSLFSPEMQSYMWFGGLIAAIFVVITAFLMFIAVAIVFYLISAAFKGQGDIIKTFEVAGYGFLPMVFGSILSSAVYYYYAPSIALPQVDPTTEAGMEAMGQAIASAPMTMISAILGILFLLWSANIWIFGMRHARALTLRHALITVGLPVGIYIIIQIWSLGVL
ncbi:hypothetical protein J2129_002178 [Methanofollis sp. W23]|uniref:Yip1 family protein n=1 Tax=Methanofollis sp. W23 TaxID=2817849 RepID=UPI001AEADBAB|nr:Yip1 family protein [Methanofollis sp. W23]MBP2146724.1 hypothetical protein [Methanofollis sp. W23]